MLCNREIGVKSLVYLLHNSYFGVDNCSIWLGGGGWTAGVENTTLVLWSMANGRAAQPTLRTFL